MENFEKISRQETNENTALILMLGVISEKLSEIIGLLKNKKQQYNPILKDDYLE